jgi:hypothetical protein
MEMGRPTIGSVKVFDHLGNEIEYEAVYFEIHDISESYNVIIVTKAGRREATIVDIISTGKQ